MRRKLLTIAIVLSFMLSISTAGARPTTTGRLAYANFWAPRSGCTVTVRPRGVFLAWYVVVEGRPPRTGLVLSRWQREGWDYDPPGWLGFAGGQFDTIGSGAGAGQVCRTRATFVLLPYWFLRAASGPL